MWAAARESSRSGRPLHALGHARREALVVHLDGNALAQLPRQALHELARLARLLVSPPRSESGSPTTTRSTSRAATSAFSAAMPRLLSGRGIVSIGVTIVPVGR